MNEGNTDVHPSPVDVQTKPAHTQSHATPLPDNLTKTMSSIQKMKDDAHGGSTAEGTKRNDARAALFTLLKDKINLTPDQFKNLSADLKKQIDQFNPQNEEELNREFTLILAKLKSNEALNEKQRLALNDIEKAVIQERTLKAEEIFDTLEDQVKKLPIEEQLEAEKELLDLEKEIHKPDSSSQEKTKFVSEKMSKLLRIFGFGGAALLIIYLWKSLAGVLGSGGGAMASPMMAG